MFFGFQVGLFLLLSLSLSLFLLGVELEISFSTYFIIHVGLTPFHLNKNYRK